jgi:hypothetical protein
MCRFEGRIILCRNIDWTVSLLLVFKLKLGNIPIRLIFCKCFGGYEVKVDETKRCEDITNEGDCNWVLSKVCTWKGETTSYED